MNELKVFANSEFGELSVLEIDDRMYFPATACAKKLGYENPQQAVRLHCKGVLKFSTPTDGGMQEINHIPEGDLYRLIVHSKLPSAERFEKRGFDEVLPSIRQTGGYGMARAEIVELVRETVQATMRAMKPQDCFEAGTKAAPRRRKYGDIRPSWAAWIRPSARRSRT